MKRIKPLIPLGIVLSVVGIVSLFIPFIYVENDYGYGGAFSPILSLNNPKYWGEDYLFAPIMMLICSIFLIFIYIAIGAFSTLSVAVKKKFSIGTIVSIVIALLFSLVILITEIITISLSTIPVIPLLYISPLLQAPLFIAVLVLSIINLITNKIETSNKENKEKIISKKTNNSYNQADELSKWKKLLDDNAITKEEYEEKKKEILNKK